MGILLAIGQQRWSSPSVGFAEATATRSDVVHVKHLSYSHHPSRPYQQQQTTTRQQQQQQQHGQSWETPDNSSSPRFWEEFEISIFLNDQGRLETASETLEQRFRYVFGAGPYQRKKKKRGKGRWITTEPFRPTILRRLENGNNGDDDKYNKDDMYNYDDDATNDDNNANNKNDDGSNNKNDDMYSAADERCSEFLVSFLEGTTDAHDTCEGMMNAYTAAGTFVCLFVCRYSFSSLLKQLSFVLLI